MQRETDIHNNGTIGSAIFMHLNNISITWLIYCRDPQIWLARSTFLQSLASSLITCDFLMILKTLIIMLRCV